MKKYTVSPFGGFMEFEDTDPAFASFTGLDATDPGVAAYLSALADSAKPKEVTMRQARLAMRQAGLLGQVEAAIAAMTGAAGEDARIEWEYSNSLKRTQPLVTQLAAGLGLSPTQVDDLFATAVTL